MGRALGMGIVLATSLFANGYAQNPAISDRSRGFPEQNCRITLPEGAEWSSRTPLPPGSIAMYEIPQIARVMVLAIKCPKLSTINDIWIRGFEEDFIAGTEWKKVSGNRIQFRGLDAYDLQIRVAESGQAAKVRVFNTADIGYQIQVAGTLETVTASATLEACLTSFAFLQPPIAPSPPSADSGNSWIWYLLRSAAWCAILSLVLWMAFYKMRKGPSEFK